MRADAFEEGHSLGLQEGQNKERIHGIKNLIQVFLDFRDDIDVAVAKRLHDMMKRNNKSGIFEVKNNKRQRYLEKWLYLTS